MLYPSHARHWWPLVEDVFMSNHVKEIGENIFKSLERNGEFLSLSVDATLKVCMTVQGQASHRAPAAVRNAACFDDESSLRRVLTIRGRAGAVVGMVPISHEDANRVAATFTSHLSPIASFGRDFQIPSAHPSCLKSRHAGIKNQALCKNFAHTHTTKRAGSKYPRRCWLQV